MEKQILALMLVFTSVPLAFGRPDEKSDKVVKAVEKLGAKVTREANGQVDSVDFRNTKVTDKDLKALKDLKGLQRLYLGGTEVTDAGLKELKQIESLVFIGLTQTQVTENGILDLQAALPECSIAPFIPGRVRANRQAQPVQETPDSALAPRSEFKARVFKISNGLVAFQELEKIPTAPLVHFLPAITLPVASDVKVHFAKGSAWQKTPEPDQELPGGLQNEKLLRAVSQGIDLNAYIKTDRAGQEIKRLIVSLPEMLPAFEKPVLKPVKEALGEIENDALPAHAVARLGSLRFRQEVGPVRGRDLMPSSALVAASPDRQFLVTCESDSILFWDPKSGERLTRIDLDSASAENPIQLTGAQEVAFSADGTRLAVSRGAGKLHILFEMGRKSKEIDFGDPTSRQGISIATSDFRPDGRALPARSTGQAGPTSTFLAFVPGANQVILNHRNSPRLRLVDLNLEKVIRTFGDDTRAVNAVALSPDGCWVALVEESDGKVQIFEVATGKKLHHFPDPAGRCSALAFSTDGKTLASASSAIHLWDVTSAILLDTVELTSAPVQVEARATPANNPRERRKPRKEAIFALQFAPDGKQLLAGFHDRIAIWDLASKKIVQHFEDANAACVRYLPDGKTLLITPPGTFRFYDIASGKPIRRFQGNQSGIAAVAFAPDGTHVATSNNTGEVSIWNRQTRAIEQASGTGIPMIYENSWLTYSRQGDSLAGVSSSGLVVWDTKTGMPTLTVPAGQTALNFRSTPPVFSADGARLSYGTSFGWAIVAEVKTGQEILCRPIASFAPGSVSISPDMTRIAWRPRSKGTPNITPAIEVQELTTGKPLHKFPGSKSGTTSQLIFSPDARTIIDISNIKLAQGTPILVGEVATGQARLSFPLQDRNPLRHTIEAITFSPDSRRLAFAKNAVTPKSPILRGQMHELKFAIHVLDLPSGVCSTALTGHEGDIKALAFSSDSKLLVSGSSDTTALIWDVESLFPNKPIPALTAAERESCWKNLTENGQVAYRNMWQLADDHKSIDYLSRELKPASIKEANEKAVIQSVRVVEVLENMRTKPAEELLTTLAGGTPDATLTQEAKQALGRVRAMMGRRTD